jgi:hypothetical protein
MKAAQDEVAGTAGGIDHADFRKTESIDGRRKRAIQNKESTPRGGGIEFTPKRG